MLFQKMRPFAFAFLLLLVCGTLALAANPPGFDDSEAGAAGAGASIFIMVCSCLFWLVFVLGYVVAPIAAMWIIFTKAGKPGWAAIVPIYNLFVLTEIIEKPILWFILCLIPCVNFAMLFMYNIELAKKFGKDALYGVGMAIFPFIFHLMLAFSNAQYTGTGVMPPS